MSFISDAISGISDFFGGSTIGKITGIASGINELGYLTGRDDPLLGNRRPTTADQPVQQSAITPRTIGENPPQENAFSGGFDFGQNQAFIGGLAPIAQGIGRALGSRTGQLLGGGAIGLGAGALTTGDMRMKKPLVMSNRNKSRIRKMLMDFGIEATVTQLNLENRIKGRPPVTINDIILLLSTTIRKQGYPVTYAMMRNTRKTLNRLKAMKDLYGDFTKSTTTRRRTMRRASSPMQKVYNVKN